ncbi:hypothetical protein [Flavobacterium granuli]|uniref:Uncharacterized protein n=1 Tax=Flavobacterium granuli TaxID=280093 RepID=A0ABU1S0F4_9FLAO|nr:hypothetical protein [Flavobacterium granuli]MDR6844516.1 hypothetical protein [Flavobacterium granuli]
MEIKITEIIEPIITHSNGDISIYGEIKTKINIEGITDSEIKELYSILKLKIEIMDSDRFSINNETKSRIMDQFRAIKSEYQSRFPVWKM